MSLNADRLFTLLPAFYRLRDAEQGGPLEALLSVVAEQAALLEEDLAQLYDDQFIETCAPWVVPYLGDLVGYRALHGTVPGVRSPRAEVANTIQYRRRKGTAAMLEALARDVTGWPAAAVEFFERIATTQHLNHLRLDRPVTVNLRDGATLEKIGTPFDGLAHTGEVRGIASGRGRFNLPHVGLFLWRLQSSSLTRSPAFQVDDRRYRFSPLGHDLPLFSLPSPETDVASLAGPEHVPAPLSRRALAENLSLHYGTGRSFSIQVNGELVPGPEAGEATGSIEICDLRDVTDAGGAVIGWAHAPVDRLAVDPALGRIAFPSGAAAPASVVVSFHYGTGADLGGGEYERAASFETTLPEGAPLVYVPDDHPTILSALGALGGASGVVEVSDSGRYEETLSLALSARQRVELRAANGSRPTLVLGADFEISGGPESEAILNGFLITGAGLRAGGNLRRLTLRHLTLAPGLGLEADGAPAHPAAPSLMVVPSAANPRLLVGVEHCITGALRLPVRQCELRIRDSIVDALENDNPAITGAGTSGPPLTIERTTVFGRVDVREFLHASDVLFDGEVVAERRQTGCLRFCYLPLSSKTPRRYRCVPEREEEEARLRPYFLSRRFGTPGYALLHPSTPREIRQGASDESEMGAFHDVYAPQRELNLRERLDEYLRFGLEAGVFVLP